MKLALKILFILLLLVVAVGLVVPEIAAGRFGEGAKQALEASLGRKVEIHDVKFNLFTGPGFTISEVTIWDDPNLSAEPILYADKLTAIPRILPLFAGRLAFSSIRLEQAHINLGRTASPDQPARWNVTALTRPALFQTFPSISVVSGGVNFIPKSRINFKIGGVKSVFYLLIDRLEISPPSSANGPWGIRLEGEPARADRPALGFGSFVADGRWTPAQGIADISVRLERSEIGDIFALLNGHDVGLYGSVSGTARLVGPLTALKINGQLDVSGLHGWDQMGSSSQKWPLAIAGTWNVPGQFFELNARHAGQPNSPVNARFRVADYLGAPHWGVSVTCQAMPLQPLLPLARQVGLPIPSGVQLNGTLDGAVSFSRTGPSEGSAQITQASLVVPGAPPLTFEDAQILIAGGHAKVAPSEIRLSDSEETGTIESDYTLETHELKVTLTSRGMDIVRLHQHAAVAAVPVLRDLQSGVWRGQLSYSTSNAWSGSFDLARATIALPQLGVPLKIAAAHADLEKNTLAVRKIQARCGDVSVAGEYRYELGARRPHRFQLTVARLKGAQLESLFRPVLFRGGRVMRALGLNRSDVPDWLAQTRADGTVELGVLDLGPMEFDHLSSRVIWDGTHIKLADLKGHHGLSALNAAADVDVSGNSPAYVVAGDVTGFSWKDGKVDADLSLDTSGAGLETLANLHAEGSFKAHNVDPDYPSIEGCFQFGFARSPRIKLTSLRLSDGEEIFVGSGSTTADGELVLDLAGVSKPVRLTLR